MLGADKPSDEIVEKFCRVHEWVVPSPDGLFEIADLPSAFSEIADLLSALSEVRARGPLSYLKYKQSILTGWVGKRQGREE